MKPNASFNDLPKEIRSSLRALVRSLKERMNDVEVYLFGSFARGDWLKNSDIDIIVVSSSFKGMEIHERYKQVRLLADRELSFEILTYTPEEFEELKERSVILKDASRYWIKL